MITLYGFGQVPRIVIGETRDLRVQWALEEAGVEYRVHGLNHDAGELMSPPFHDISYFNQVPIIDDDGFILSETGAILLYIAEKSGKLIPSDSEGRTRVLQWCFVALSTVELPLADIQLSKFLDPQDNAKRNKFLTGWAHRVLGGVERRLEGREWIACEQFTVADILLACVLREIRKTNLMENHPRTRSYYSRALERPAWKKTLELYATRLGVNPQDIE